MSRKAYLLLTLLAVVMLVTLLEMLMIKQVTPSQINRELIKTQAAELIQLPDLALGGEATWLRHRSLAAPFAVFPEDGALLDYYPASFIYHLQIPQSHASGVSP